MKKIHPFPFSDTLLAGQAKHVQMDIFEIIKNIPLIKFHNDTEMRFSVGTDVLKEMFNIIGTPFESIRAENLVIENDYYRLNGYYNAMSSTNKLVSYCILHPGTSVIGPDAGSKLNERFLRKLRGASSINGKQYKNIEGYITVIEGEGSSSPTMHTYKINVFVSDIRLLDVDFPIASISCLEMSNSDAIKSAYVLPSPVCRYVDRSYQYLNGLRDCRWKQIASIPIAAKSCLRSGQWDNNYVSEIGVRILRLGSKRLRAEQCGKNWYWEFGNTNDIMKSVAIAIQFFEEGKDKTADPLEFPLIAPGRWDHTAWHARRYASLDYKKIPAKLRMEIKRQVIGDRIIRSVTP